MKIYKYRGGDAEITERDIKALVENYFWAPTIENLNDPAEGFVNSDDIKMAFQALQAKEVETSFDELLKIVKSGGIYSLSRTPLDELMWAYYANGHKGFCIEYDLNRLTLEARSAWDVVHVSYADNPQTISFDDIDPQGEHKPMLSKFSGTKSVRWSHEQEVRIITSNAGKNHYAQLAVTGIYFGCRSTPSLVLQVRKALKGRALSYYQAEHSPHSYSMSAREIDRDLDIDGPISVHLAPVDEHAIPPIESTNDEHKSFYFCLQKAVEIVRNDPSCIKVLISDFSNSKSSTGETVAYVLYESNTPTSFRNTLKRSFSVSELNS